MVVADGKTYLEVAAREVLDIPTRRQRVLERIAAAKELEDQAREKLRRVIEVDNASREEEREAVKELERAAWHLIGVREGLSSDQLDPENRKAVARQMAGLIREDLEQRLNEIAARSSDPEVRRAVANYKDEVARATHRFITKRFPPARELRLDERNKARAEARAILNRFYYS
jgi:hypothetical protein